MGAPKYLLISAEAEGDSDQIEKKIRDNLKPRDLEVGILSAKRKQKRIAIKTKNQEDTTLTENAIKESRRLKKFIVKVPEKYLPRIILYNVYKDTTEEAIMTALIS